MSLSRDARSVRIVTRRRADPKTVGPLAGWAWRDARSATQFGKRQGAFGIEFRPKSVRFFFGAAMSDGADHHGQKRQSPRATRQAAPPSRQSSDQMDTGRSVTVSKRKQKSAARLQEYQQRVLKKLRWQHFLTRFAKMWRHQRMWNVHNAWYATRSAPAEPAGPPAIEPERTAEDSRSMSRAAEPVEQQPIEALRSVGAAVDGAASHGQGSQGLSEFQQEYCPWLSMAEVEVAWCAAVARSVWAESPRAPAFVNRHTLVERMKECVHVRREMRSVGREVVECVQSGLCGRDYAARQVQREREAVRTANEYRQKREREEEEYRRAHGIPRQYEMWEPESMGDNSD